MVVAAHVKLVLAGSGKRQRECVCGVRLFFKKCSFSWILFFLLPFRFPRVNLKTVKTWFCPKLFCVMMKKIINNSASFSDSSLKQELAVPGMARTVLIPGIRSPRSDRI